MSEEPKDPYPVDHSALLQRAKDFKVLIEIDGKQTGIVLTAFNRKSIMPLLQFVMIANRKRIAGYVVRTMPLIEGSYGELIGAVPGASFVSQMIANTRLKDPAPKEVPEVKLPYWDAFQIKPKEPAMGDTKNYILEMVTDGIVEKFPITGANDESVIALLTAATCEKMPRIGGWNLYDVEGKMVASVPAMTFLAKLAESTSLGKQPADPKSVGWRALPAVAPINEQFKKDIESAKKEGKDST